MNDFSYMQILSNFEIYLTHMADDLSALWTANISVG